MMVGLIAHMYQSLMSFRIGGACHANTLEHHKPSNGEAGILPAKKLPAYRYGINLSELPVLSQLGKTAVSV